MTLTMTSMVMATTTMMTPIMTTRINHHDRA